MTDVVRRTSEISQPAIAAAIEADCEASVGRLFADLAGSTALGGRLDPEDVRELQGELFEFLNAEVERHGGMTENSSATR